MRGRFDVWAPRPERVRLSVGDDVVEMTKGADGWWTPDGPVPEGEVDYGYLVDDSDQALPDPRSRRQPDGVHERSRTFDPSGYEWNDGHWTGRQLAGSVVYELHLGTFTPEGTLDAAADRLDHLVELGVDLVELLPVNAFNGSHNWGYDGVLWSAVDEDYGGPAAYQRFVDAAHAAGLGVIQDVVHNHLGPSGNYLPVFGPYVKTDGEGPWGSQVNLDGEQSAEVRRYILDSVQMWFTDYHVDGLRLDAVHALSDASDTHLLEQMAIEVGALSAHLRRPLTLIAESDLNDPRMVTPREAGGLGVDAQWSDDFHHAVHVALTGETSGYYADFEPLTALAKVCEQGFFHDGTFSSFRGREHGVPIDTAKMPTWRSGGGQPEPRPGRQPGHGRPARRTPRRGPARVCGHAHAGRPVHADALPGRGVGGLDAVPVLHLPPRGGPGSGDGRGSHQGVRADGLGRRRRTRPTGPGHLPALEAGLVRTAVGNARARARGLPAARRAAAHAARADRPLVRVDRVHGGRGLPTFHDAARQHLDGRELRARPAELKVDEELTLVFRTPSRPSLTDGTLQLPAHTGALLAPADS